MNPIPPFTSGSAMGAPKVSPPSSAVGGGGAPATLTNLLENGNWGQAFLTRVVPPLNLPPGISQNEIDAMFSWDPAVSNVSGHGGAQSCRHSFAQAVEDLLKLPTGRDLFGRIITACYNNKNNPPHNPQKLLFINNGTDDGFYADYPCIGQIDRTTCAINLKWNAAINQHMSMDWVLVVNNNNQLDFAKVIVPPSLILAHELGHFLYALELGAAVQGNQLLQRAMNGKAHPEYQQILNGVVNLGRARPKIESVFLGLWNHQKYVDFLNILPAADMLVPPDLTRLHYSDGIMIGEALNSNVFPKNQIQFFDSAGASKVIRNLAAITSSSFVRFSHNDFNDFNSEWNKLNGQEKITFKTIVQKLLDKIIVNGLPLSVANNNLPNF
ncbi:MAG: hypothetical protein LBC30_03275 [Puniceicoccales bacterium]|jgi:hypothetical protein|nr:hypothetical protein [Puniceicoccales bacterium]